METERYMNEVTQHILDSDKKEFEKKVDQEKRDKMSGSPKALFSLFGGKGNGTDS